MKKIWLLFIIQIFFLVGYSQTQSSIYNSGFSITDRLDNPNAQYIQDTIAVIITEPGTLKAELQKLVPDYKLILNLSVTGPLNGTDIMTLRQMAGAGYFDINTSYGRLTVLNLANAQIVEGGNSYYGYDLYDDFKQGYNSIRYQPYTTYNNAIPDYSFRNCQWLKSLAIPNSVNSIGAFAFSNCTNLFSMNIPQGISGIGYSAFSNCSALTEINVADENADYCSLDGVLFDKERKTLIQYPIGNSRTDYQMPNGIIEIGSSSFCGCKNLSSIIIPNGVTLIRDDAFKECLKLTEISIPESVTDIGLWVFNYCNNLTSINVSPDNLEYSSLDGVLFDKNMRELIQYPIGNSRTSYTIPSNVICSNNAFAGCGNLISIDVSRDNMNYCSVDGVLFDKTQKILIQYPIGNSRTSYSVNDSIHTIGLSSFSNCQNLTSIIFGNGLQQIRSGSFKGCFHLSEIYSKADNPPTLEVFNNIGAFDGVRISLVQLHVPYGKKSEYQLVGGWRNFKNIID